MTTSASCMVPDMTSCTAHTDMILYIDDVALKAYTMYPSPLYFPYKWCQSVHNYVHPFCPGTDNCIE